MRSIKRYTFQKCQALMWISACYRPYCCTEILGLLRKIGQRVLIIIYRKTNMTFLWISPEVLHTVVDRYFNACKTDLNDTLPSFTFPLQVFLVNSYQYQWPSEFIIINVKPTPSSVFNRGAFTAPTCSLLIIYDILNVFGTK